ncbi:hypothetical protein TNCT_59421 [Trichonephila clavata]|uniref:Uncharacterized protein n=1 Tax=Trichonephila clavata TaxID=2740835 RepID=A0A8X6K7R2_TRICU|nr:hypothetical protein TNCT_59421 [Trichonephila clavata]
MSFFFEPNVLPTPRHNLRVMGGPSRVHQNARVVCPELCSESFHRTVNVMPRMNDHYACIPPPKPDGRVIGGPSCVHQNARSVGPQHCSELFHSMVNAVPLRNECFANPPQ